MTFTIYTMIVDIIIFVIGVLSLWGLVVFVYLLTSNSLNCYFHSWHYEPFVFYYPFTGLFNRILLPKLVNREFRSGCINSYINYPDIFQLLKRNMFTNEQLMKIVSEQKSSFWKLPEEYRTEEMIEYVVDNMYLDDKRCAIYPYYWKLRAVENNGLLIKDISNVTTKLCELAIQNNIEALEYVSQCFLNEKIYCEVVRKNPMYIQKIYPWSLTQKIVDCATTDITALNFVPDKFDISKHVMDYIKKHLQNKSENVHSLKITTEDEFAKIRWNIGQNVIKFVPNTIRGNMNYRDFVGCIFSSKDFHQLFKDTTKFALIDDHDLHYDINRIKCEPIEKLPFRLNDCCDEQKIIVSIPISKKVWVAIYDDCVRTNAVFRSS